MINKIALLDFDGTLTDKDTLFDLAKFSTSKYKYLYKIMLLTPVFVIMKLKLLSKQKGKGYFLKLFYNGMTEQDFNETCTKYCRERLPQIIRPKGLSKIEEFIVNDYEIFIVSASPENWIKPWAHQYKIKVIATHLELVNQKITGNIAGINCNGQEKVNRINQEIDLSQYDEILVFGDTKGDLPMLELATQKHYKPFT
ncbi:MAG: haloacid dehalogenase-like hydrolase [Reichenbachiella sp.]